MTKNKSKILNGELCELSEFFLFTGGHKGSESAKVL